MKEALKAMFKWCADNPKKAFALIPSILTAFAAVLGDAHELYLSIKTGADFGKSDYAIEQSSLWGNNIQCFKDNQFTIVVNPHNVEVGTLVCKSGDILISAKQPDDQNPSYKWVSWKESIEPVDDSDASISLFPMAVAQEQLCSVWIGGGILIQVIAMPNGCFKQKIDTYTGRVIESTPVDCNSGC